jgi:hypothetical protein
MSEAELQPDQKGAEMPLFTDAFALCEWLLGLLGADDKVLSRALCKGALSLLQSVTLALKGRSREAQLAAADEQLIALRVQLRMACATGVLTKSQLLHGMEAMDNLGCQLGGWRRHLGLGGASVV